MYYNDPRAQPVQLTAVGLVLLAFAYLVVADARKDFHLARDGQRAPGVVTAVYPQNHDTLEYRFEYQGKTYTQLGGHDSELVGSPITVTFDPKNPAISTIEDPLVVGRNTLFFLFAFLVPVMAAFVLVVFFWWRRTRLPSKITKS